MNPGRNGPCRCGSGRKYKHCCGAPKAAPSESPEDLQWRRLRRAIEPLPVELLRFSGDYFGPMGLAEAWDEFTGWEDGPFDAHSPHIPVFMPWFFHNWTPDLPETEVRMEARAEVTAAQAYLARKGRRLDPLTPRYLEACAGVPFSFYDVSACEPGRGFTLRDILTGEECRVTERSASCSVSAGDVLFAKIVRLEGLAVMEACSSIIIPPDRKWPVLELRKRIREAEAQLPSSGMADWETELIGIPRTGRRAPQPAAAPIAEHRRRAAGLAQTGVRDRIAARGVRRALEKRLGPGTKHLSTKVQSTEAMLMRMQEDRGGQEKEQARPGTEEQERLAALPEVRQAIAEQMRAHFEQWADQEIPALGGQTPRQAVQDFEGCEMVEALILNMERLGPAMSPPLDASILRELRQRLGL